MPKVSVIMPSYNVASYIEECLKSVIDQTLRDIEIICIDAGSTDGTIDIIEKYSSIDDRIRIIHSNKKSYGYQVNVGINTSQGEYIGLVETDDFVDPTMYEKLYLFAKENQADVVKGPYIEYYNNKVKQVCYYADLLNRTLPNKCFSAKEYGLILSYHASVWSGLYKKSYIRENNIFLIEAESASYVDVNFRIQTCINTTKIAWYKEPLYFYRVNNVNSSTNNFNLSSMLERWKEVHRFFNEYKADYEDYYGKYLILDEYLNTLAYLDFSDISKDELEMMIENYSSVNKKIIISSPVINRKIKERILSFKENPYLYYKKVNKHVSTKKKIKRLLNFIIPKGTKMRIILKKVILLKNANPVT